MRCDKADRRDKAVVARQLRGPREGHEQGAWIGRPAADLQHA